MEERIYTINLRKSSLKTPRWEKSKDSVAVVRNFLKKHMKSDDVKIDGSISEKIWSHGGSNPPNKIRIKVTKTDDEIKAILWERSSEEEKTDSTDV
jgi:large subunit ribosomal protein L31e